MRDFHQVILISDQLNVRQTRAMNHVRLRILFLPSQPSLSPSLLSASSFSLPLISLHILCCFHPPIQTAPRPSPQHQVFVITLHVVRRLDSGRTSTSMHGLLWAGLGLGSNTAYPFQIVTGACQQWTLYFTWALCYGRFFFALKSNQFATRPHLFGPSYPWSEKTNDRRRQPSSAAAEPSDPNVTAHCLR